MASNPTYVQDYTLFPHLHNYYGTWELIGQEVINKAVFSKTYQVNGEIDNRYRTIVSLKSEKRTVPLSNITEKVVMKARFNNLLEYQYGYHEPDNYKQHLNSAATGDLDYMYLGSGRVIFAEANFRAKRGNIRYGLVREVHNGSGFHFQNTAIQWYNTTDAINSIELFTDDPVSGVVFLYRWKPKLGSKVYTFEQVYEWNLDNELLDKEITWDTEKPEQELMYVEVGLTETDNSGNDYLYCYFNNTTIPNTIERREIIQTKGETVQSQTKDNLFRLTPTIQNGVCFSITEFAIMPEVTMGLTIGHCMDKFPLYDADHDSTLFTYLEHFLFGITGTRIVNKVNFKSTSPVSGTIRVFKKVDLQLQTQQFDFMEGMFQQTVGSQMVRVHPGVIDIGGELFTLPVSKDLMFRMNIREGEAESPGSYYYLYAVHNTTTHAMEFKFSLHPPLMDRYGNIADKFEDCKFVVAWCHPIEGLKWRYIGQVFLKMNMTLVPFDKCLPGYWESPWMDINYGFTYQPLWIEHSHGKQITDNFDLMCWYDKDATSKPLPCPRSFDQTRRDQGFVLFGSEPRRISINWCNYGVYYYNGNWRSDGKFKLVSR